MPNKWLDKGTWRTDMPHPSGRGRMNVILLESEARAVSGVSDIFDLGDWNFIQFMLNITASQTSAADTLDVIIEMSTDKSSWINVAQFTQQAGNGSAAVEIATLVTLDKEGETTVVDPDSTFTMVPGAGVVAQAAIGRFLRVSYTITSDSDPEHTFSVSMYIGFPPEEDD